MTVEDLENQENQEVNKAEGEAPAFDANALLSQHFGEMDDPNGYSTALSDLIKQRDENTANGEKFQGMLDRDSRLGSLIENLSGDDNSDLMIGLAKAGVTSDDFPQEGDDNFEAYNKIRGEQSELDAKRKAQLSELEENSKKMSATRAKHLERYKDNEEGGREFDDFMNGLGQRYISNSLTAEDMENIDKLRNMDALMNTAREEAKIAGRNEAIQGKRNGAAKGDGMPDLTGGAAKGGAHKKGNFTRTKTGSF